jgi:hypothetical protein
LADITEKLTSVLSDGDGLKQTSEFTDSVKDSADNNTYSNNPCEYSDSDKPGIDTAAINDLFGNVDLSQILGLVGMFTAPKEDKNVNFLMALKPLLSEERATKVDMAVRVLKMIGIYSVLKDSGMISGIKIKT